MLLSLVRKLKAKGEAPQHQGGLREPDGLHRSSWPDQKPMSFTFSLLHKLSQAGGSLCPFCKTSPTYYFPIHLEFQFMLTNLKLMFDHTCIYINSVNTDGHFEQFFP